MIRSYSLLILLAIVLTGVSCKKEPPPVTDDFQLSSIKIGAITLDLSAGSTNTGIPVNQPIILTFSEALDITTVSQGVHLTTGGNEIGVSFSFLQDNMQVKVTADTLLSNSTNYQVQVTDKLKALAGKTFGGITVNFTTEPGTLKILSIYVSGKNLLDPGIATDIDRNFPAVITFDHPLDPSSVNPTAVRVTKNGIPAAITFFLSDSNRKINVNATSPLVHFDKYTLDLSADINGAAELMFDGFSRDFYTAIDSTPKFPVVSDDELMTIVQEQTFKYFWDFGHPVSGLARERETSGDLVTIGGSGLRHHVYRRRH
jgi:hypothetical protein